MKTLRALFVLLSVSYTCVTEAESGMPEVDLLNAYTLSILYSDNESFATQLGATIEMGKSSLLLDAGYSSSSQQAVDSKTYRGGIEFDHFFKPVGFALGYRYWGDQDRITSHGARGSLYIQNADGKAAFNYERRNIELKFDLPPGTRGLVDNSRSTDSNGYGLSLRRRTQYLDLYANGMKYDYDVDLTRLASLINLSRLTPTQRADFLSHIGAFLINLGRLNASSLSLANTLLDYNIAIGADFRTENYNTINVELARDVAATDGVALDSVSLGYTHSLANHVDIEYRLGASKGDNVESSYFGGVTFYWYH